MSAGRRILILGGGGQLGRSLAAHFAGAGEVTAADRRMADLAAPDALRQLVRELRPEVILNAAAYTAVDRAEQEPALAWAVNAEAPRVLAEEARALDALLVHYSTDYVFDGAKAGAWTEDDPPAPLNAYGASKLGGERAISAVGGRALVFRTSWVYAAEGKNFLSTMLRLGRERDRLCVVDDQGGAPTPAGELALGTRTIVDGVLAGRFGSAGEWAGLYHMSCAGATSWCGFARAIFARAGGPAPAVEAIRSEEYPTPARRPLNSVLSNEKLAARFGVRLPAWEQALDGVMNELKRGQG
ncbi:MAG: dTDP-4-dehydrorhamnose reductase [Terracidiphilus sp.]